MENSLTIGCPHCGEEFPLAIDPSEGNAQFTIDCEVCCRPMNVRLSFGEDGELTACDVAPE